MAGIQPMQEPPPARFVPVAPGAWASYDFATGASTQMRFEHGELIIATPAGEVRGTRSRSASEIEQTDG